jgi:hypothetical protein
MCLPFSDLDHLAEIGTACPDPVLGLDPLRELPAGAILTMCQDQLRPRGRRVTTLREEW